MSDIQDTRLMVLGQIAVMRSRLDRMEQKLLERPSDTMTPDLDDAISNLSFQSGVLVGTLTKYKDTLK